MAVEIIEGESVAAEPMRVKRGYALYDTLTIRDSSGKERVFKKVAAGRDVDAALRKGGKGRFYVSNFGGASGIHGVRMADGTAAYGHYNNLEMIVLLGIAAGAAMLVLGLLGIADFMITPVIIGAALLVGFFFIRHHRLEGKRQYDADARGGGPG